MSIFNIMATEMGRFTNTATNQCWQLGNFITRFRVYSYPFRDFLHWTSVKDYFVECLKKHLMIASINVLWTIWEFLPNWCISLSCCFFLFVFFPIRSFSLCNLKRNGKAHTDWDRHSSCCGLIQTLCSSTVNSVCWGPYDFGLILACGSSDGAISVLTCSGDGHWDIKKINNAHTVRFALIWDHNIAKSLI